MRSRPSQVIVAGGSRELAWHHPGVAAELLGCCDGPPDPCTGAVDVVEITA